MLSFQSTTLQKIKLPLKTKYFLSKTKVDANFGSLSLTLVQQNYNTKPTTTYKVKTYNYLKEMYIPSLILGSLNLSKHSKHSKNRSFFSIPTNFPQPETILDLDNELKKNQKCIDKSTSENQLEVELFGIIFVFNGTQFTVVEKEYTLTELLNIGFSIERSLNSVNKKGYVTKTTLSHPLFVKILNHLKNLKYKVNKDQLGDNEVTFSLWFNVVRINFLFLITKNLKVLKPITFDCLNNDLIFDLEAMYGRVLASLDPFLRIQLQKRGITIIQQTYTSFDTEYVNKTTLTNELISVQSATATRTLVKVPLYRKYDISYTHPLTSEITTYFKPKNNWRSSKNLNTTDTLIEMNIINDSLKACVGEIRKLKYTSLDLINNDVIEALHNIDNINFYEDDKKDHIVFALPITTKKTKIVYPQNGYSMTELIQSSKNLVSEDFDKGVDDIIEALQNLKYTADFDKIGNWAKRDVDKPRSRTNLTFNTGDKISFSLIKNHFMISHYNAADLSMLSDFSEFKVDLNIVNKSFVTLGHPLTMGGVNLYLRDTHLLTPAFGKSLSALGKLYESELGFVKKEISKSDLEDMRKFLKKDPAAFEDYALTDALIPLTHAITLEKFNFSLKRIGIPITLSSLGRTLVLDRWNEIFEKHFPYQPSGDCLMGNVDETITPKGLFSTGDIGLHLSYFIGNYKGGRNESFMFGCDEKTVWFDYDLAAAYTSAMTHLSLPDYNKGRLLDPEDLKSWTNEQLLNGYLIINGSFSFPSNTKYPSIPCYIDNSTTVYPLTGKCLLTGPEYLLAKNQKCSIEIKSVFFIPATEREKKVGMMTIKNNVRPFYEIMKEVQAKRREHPKGHVLNALYKELGNSIYGNLVRGMSNKMSFDTTTGKMFRIRATELSNPILASWTTAFIRSVIGECLHNIARLGGRVVSVTTDGFITDLVNLEEKLLSLPEVQTPLFKLFTKIRNQLTDEDSDTQSNVLELKNSDVGIISWTTRGQYSFNGRIKATTGFQVSGYDNTELVTIFKNTLKAEVKEFEYTQSRIRSAKDIFNNGGQVTNIYKDQRVRLIHDNRRSMISQEGDDVFDMSNQIVDSQALTDVSECLKRRFMSKYAFQTPYLKNQSSRVVVKSVYRNFIEIGVRNFIKGYLADDPLFGLKGIEFNNYESIILFIKGFDLTKSVKISKSSISQLKSRPVIFKPVPRTIENINFAEYIKGKFPYFDISNFLKN